MSAPYDRVNTIIKAFRGVLERATPPGTQAKFANTKDEKHAIVLINMLPGWHAKSHSEQQHVIQISAI